MSNTEAATWLRLSLLPEWNTIKLKQLYEKSAAGSADPRSLLPPTCPESVEALFQNCMQWAACEGNHLLPITSDHYPGLLREIADPPPVLFVQGSVECLSLPQLGMVGSRKPTSAGRRLARQFAAELCKAGYLVTSGLALGIDGESHQGALEAGGKTIAVLGSGLEHLYPQQHHHLAAAIIENCGALISELPPSFSPQAFNFPLRNRIISGLSHGVLVVEAARRSGSLITARLAAEQGREVFSIPGSVRSTLSQGCHFLIRKGAKLVETVADIMEELPAMVAWENERLALSNPLQSGAGIAPDRLSLEARTVLGQIAYEPSGLDEIAEASGLPVATTASCLTQLELAGLVVQDVAGYVLNT